MFQLLRSTKVTTRMCPDSVFSLLLKHCLTLINSPVDKYLSTHPVPDCRRLAIILAILKPIKFSFPASYFRPIAFASCGLKLIGRDILRRLTFVNLLGNFL